MHSLVPWNAFSAFELFCNCCAPLPSRIPRPSLQLVTALILGSTFWRSGYDAQGIRNRASFFIFSITSLVFPSFFALPIFIEERKIYIRETSRGAYRTVSYVLADAIVWLPFLFILGLIFASVVYFMVGLAPTVAAFFG